MQVTYRFCPRCGQPLSLTLLFGRERARCTACGFIHFQNPKVAVAVLVTDGPRVLLVKRAVAPQIGFWSLPAGFVDFDELPAAAAGREVEEETGLCIEITDFLEIFPMPQGAAWSSSTPHGLLSHCRLMPGDDVSDAAWFASNALPADLAFESTRTVLTTGNSCGRNYYQPEAQSTKASLVIAARRLHLTCTHQC